MARRFNRAQRKAVRRYRKSFPKGERPPKIRKMTEAERNAAYEFDMRGGKPFQYNRPQDKIKRK